MYSPKWTLRVCLACCCLKLTLSQVIVNLLTPLNAWEWIRFHLLIHLYILGRGHTPVIPDSGGGDWRKEEPMFLASQG